MTKFITLAVLIAFSLSLNAQKLTQVWESEKVLDTPESVFLSDDILYVNSIGGKDGMAKDSNGFISKLSKDGEIIELKWVDGLNGPKGLFVTTEKVFVADIDQVKIFDKKTGKLLEEITLEGSTFLNDLIVTENGVIIVTDYKDTKIYRIQDKTVSVLVKDERLDHVNGLDYRDSRLLAGTNSHVFEVDLNNGSLKVWSDAPVWIDGIEPLSENKILVSDWGGKIVLLEKDKEATMLIELDSKEYNTADMDFDPVTKRAYVPTFFRNTVICFQYEE